jgi:microcystin-dependent protein
LLSAGDEYMAGSTGGESDHTLTVDEMPQHSHLLSQDVITDNISGDFLVGIAAKWYHTFNVLIGTTELESGGQPHNNIPPYLTVYVWKRVA